MTRVEYDYRLYSDFKDLLGYPAGLTPDDILYEATDYLRRSGGHHYSFYVGKSDSKDGRNYEFRFYKDDRHRISYDGYKRRRW